jgi:hypothetical protein
MTTKQELEQLKKQIAELEAKIAQEEKQEIKTCEDAFNKLKPEWYIDGSGKINTIKLDEIDKFEYNQCNMTSEKEAKRIKALIQLRLIAEAMNEGVEGDNYWFIGADLKANYSAVRGSFVMLAPIFKTEQLAEQALTNFKHLFQDLYES